MQLSDGPDERAEIDRAHELLARQLGVPRSPSQATAPAATGGEATDAAGPVAQEPFVQHVEFDPELHRWYVRFTCDGRDATTIYFDLHERTLRYEIYFLPDPPANHLELYRYLLRRNHTMYGARFSIGPDGDVYLIGRIALEHLTEVELDRIIGVLYELVETWFQPVVRLAYGRRAAPPGAAEAGQPAASRGV